jgi:predicted RNA-binding protein with RPS1 domain
MTALVLTASLFLAFHAPLQGTSSNAAASRGRPCVAALFEQKPLKKGDEWEGLISKITDYGFFAKVGHEQHMGLVHIATLTTDRLPRMEVADWIEENVGPIGSKVRVVVESLQFKGQKRTSFRLMDVISQQTMEQLVFEPGPGREALYDEDDD